MDARMLGEVVLQQLHLSPSALLEFAVSPIAKVLVLCGFGAAMASPYINILPAPSRRLLSKVMMILQSTPTPEHLLAAHEIVCLSSSRGVVTSPCEKLDFDRITVSFGD
jgi:hypothetical protein